MNLKTLFKWLIPIAALLFICVAFAGITGGLTWLSSRAGQNAESISFGDLIKSPGEETVSGQFTGPGGVNHVFIPILSSPGLKSPDTAVLEPAHGIVQLQQADGSWVTVQKAETITVGRVIRTWTQSSAVLYFYDGSFAILDADTRLTLESINAPADGPREIVFFQPYGNSTHNVAKPSDYAISYIINTPSSSGTAKGTVFEVSVQDDKSSQFNVLEGAVDVTGKSETVRVTAGQTSYVVNDDEPSDPVFWISGEGEVTQTGDVWVIGGIEFQNHEVTVIVGDPQMGDLVSVRGRLLPDGTRLADRISLLAPSVQENFRLTGLVESMGDTHWIVSGQEISVNETTQMDEGIEIGSRVLVTGVIRTGGVLFAKQITLLNDEDTHFEFTGLLESIDERIWMISGVPVTIDQNTIILGDPAVGDLVHVEGRIMPDGTWLAREIEKVSEANDFEIIGTVDSIAPWTVSGVSFEVNEFTRIEPGIVVGSMVRVVGLILDDGTWLATSIELLEDTNTLVFIGIVDSTDPWVVNGLTLTVDENTVFTGDIVVASLVRVTVLIQPDGTWLVLSMELIEVGPVVGCIEFVDTVAAISREQITLSSGVVIPVGIAEIEGDLQVGNQVLVKLCFGPDNVMVFAWILVLDDSIRPTPTPGPTGTPRPDDDDKVTICHIPPGNPGNAHTITVGASAVDAHLGHGDYLGPCTGNEGDDNDKDDKDKGNKDKGDDEDDD
jgi:hypothetical protein